MKKNRTRENVADERSGENLAENADATPPADGSVGLLVSFLRVTQATLLLAPV
jgi:hypothetical protein